VNSDLDRAMRAGMASPRFNFHNLMFLRWVHSSDFIARLRLLDISFPGLPCGRYLHFEDVN